MLKSLFSALVGSGENAAVPSADVALSPKATGSKGREAIRLRYPELKSDIHDPSAEVLAEVMMKLGTFAESDDKYLILENPNVEFGYIQAWVDLESEAMGLEYQVAKTEALYATTLTDPALLQQVFLRYNDDDISWTDDFEWTVVDY